MKIDSKYIIFQRLLFIAALTAFALAIYGWWHVLPADGSKWLQTLTRSLLFFAGEGVQTTYETNSMVLKIAELLALLCTFSAVIWGLIALLLSQFSGWRTAHLKQHLVIIGFTEVAKSLLLAEKKPNQAVVVIDSQHSQSNEDFCALHHQVSYLVGDVTDTALLTAAAVNKAKCIIIATDKDSFNLRILAHIRTLMSQNAPYKEIVKAYLKIECHVFWREIAQSDLLQRTKGGVEVVPFNLSVMAARHFIWHYPLYSYADLQDQQRIHCLLLGHNAYAESLIEKVLSSCPYKDFERPYFTLLVIDAVAAEKHYRNKYPEIHRLQLLKFIEHHVDTDSLSSSLLKEVQQIAPVTALFVFSDDNDAALRQMINTRNELLRNSHRSPPIFIQMSHTEGVQHLIALPDQVKQMQDLCVPYGVCDDVCSLDMLEGELEGLAEQFHINYTHVQKSQDKPNSVTSSVDWRDLSETHRESNRRAVDHIPAKLATAGCYRTQNFKLISSKSFVLADTKEQLEFLSELEQKSWTLGRYVNGWRTGDKRNDKYKIHPLLGKKYSDLKEKDKDNDREQVKLLRTILAEKANDIKTTLRKDCWIGLIGHNHITTEETTYIQAALEKELEKIILSPDHSTAFFSLVTPLAPGSDSILVQAALDYFTAKKIPHRLLIVEEVPFDYVLDDYINNEHNFDREQLENTRNKLINHESTDWLISLNDDDKDYHQQTVREQAYHRVAEYINARCHTLIAVCRKDSVVHKGGTAASLLERPAAIQGNSTFWQEHFVAETIEIDPQAKEVRRSRVIESLSLS